MNYLITGGAGFIGSHLVEKLLAEGHGVTVLDNLSTGTNENITSFTGNEAFEFNLGSILNAELVDTLVSKCDQVYHLAAAVGVKYIMENPVETIRTNTIGTENILHSCSHYMKKVMIASSSEVYGKAMRLKSGSDGLDEESETVYGSTRIKRWSYATSKALDEFLALAYYHERNLPVVIIRLFNTVGPRQLSNYGMVIPIFVRKALSGEPLPVFGDGSQQRSFTYVGDVVEAMVKIMDCAQAEGQVVNIGNENEITIDELAQLIVTKSGSKSKIVHISYEEAYGIGFEDMARRKPDITKLKNLINFEPTLEIGEVIEKVIDYYRAM
ncbi:MAG: GDP-mannose 4,6-dehydratase [Anaerolineales bacterium]|nr:GDP-mannose 4,6-dehydratase [Anaerolineales bacterium]